jgi:hypothetical protein
LVRIPLSPPLKLQLTVVYPKERIQGGIVKTFVQFAKERLEPLPGERVPARR